MKKLIITRKKKFSGAILPYWIIVGTRKKLFMQHYGFEGDLCKMNFQGFAVARIDVEELDRLGTRIGNGQTIEFEVADDVDNLFVSTMQGCLSNEINIDEYLASGKKVVINTTGGFTKLSCPVIED